MEKGIRNSKRRLEPSLDGAHKSERKRWQTRSATYKSVPMSSVICGAIKRNGEPCGGLVVVGGKRCAHHGGLSTGPRSPAGRLASGARLRLYRINGPGKGHRKTDKTRKHREAMIKRRQLVAERQERRRARLEHKRRITLGLPLVNLADFGKLDE